MATSNIVGLIPTTQATALVGHNIGVISKNKKITTKDILSLGITNITGTTLIKATADIGAGI